MTNIKIFGYEPDGKRVKLKLLNKLNVEFPDGNCEWYSIDELEIENNLQSQNKQLFDLCNDLIDLYVYDLNDNKQYKQKLKEITS